NRREGDRRPDKAFGPQRVASIHDDAKPAPVREIVRANRSPLEFFRQPAERQPGCSALEMRWLYRNPGARYPPRQSSSAELIAEIAHNVFMRGEALARIQARLDFGPVLRCQQILSARIE